MAWRRKRSASQKVASAPSEAEALRRLEERLLDLQVDLDQAATHALQDLDRALREAHARLDRLGQEIYDRRLKLSS